MTTKKSPPSGGALNTQVTSGAVYWWDSKSLKTPPEEYTSVNLV